MITQKSLAEENLEERRKRLAAQADAMLGHYGQEPEKGVGLVTKAPENPAPRFRSDDDLWC